jgi:hypothetical protein
LMKQQWLQKCSIHRKILIQEIGIFSIQIG